MAPSKAGLINHKKNNPHDIIYKCKYCDFMGGSQRNITSHTRNIHKDINMTKCDICGKILSSRSHLEDHIMTVHKKIKHPCNICGNQLATNSGLIAHKQSMHKHDLEAKLLVKLECKI